MTAEQDMRDNIAAGIHPRAAIADDRMALLLLGEIDKLRARAEEAEQFIRDDALSRIKIAVGKAEKERDDALEVIAKIRALHRPGALYIEPNGSGTFAPCAECEDDYPCATAQLLP